MRNRLKEKSIIFIIAIFILISGRLKVFRAIFYYMNLDSYGSTIGTLLWVLIDSILLMYYLKNQIRYKRYINIGIILIINLIFAIPYVVTLNFTGLGILFILVSPISLCFDYIVSNDLCKEFISFVSKVSNGMVFLAVGYIVFLFLGDTSKYGIAELEYFSYGDIAYALLPFMICDIVTFLDSKKYNLIKVEVYMIAITYTGTRSAMLSVIFGIILILLIYIIFERNNLKNYLKRTTLIICSILIALTICNTVDVKGSRFSVVTSKNVLYEVSENSSDDNFVDLAVNMDNNKEDTVENIYKYYIWKNDKSKEETEKLLQEDIKNGTEKYIKVDDKKKWSKYSVHLDRIMLWESAINEFKKAPIIGMGLLHYHNKYSGYFPHNVILEALADMGIIGLIVLFAIFICACKCTYNSIKLENKSRVVLFILMFAYIPSLLLYNELYSNSIILAASSIIASIHLQNRNRKLEAGKVDEKID